MRVLGEIYDSLFKTIRENLISWLVFFAPKTDINSPMALSDRQQPFGEQKTWNGNNNTKNVENIKFMEIYRFLYWGVIEKKYS